MGDPAGCGPRITIEAWKQRKDADGLPFFVIGDPLLYEGALPISTISHADEVHDLFRESLPVLPLNCDGIDELTIGTPSETYAPAILGSIERATAFCQAGTASGVVTNPISKSVLYRASFKFPGHTEYIAELCQTDEISPIHPVMMLVGGGLRVSLVTIHVPLMKVGNVLSVDLLTEVAEITHHAMQRDFGIKSPRLAFSGLNPHAGEDASIGTEERDLINPVAQSLRAKGIEISDARPGDTVFHEALTGAYDAVIAMTHDQGLIPVKTLDMWGGVNTTLGLPIIRTSPDHGTAYDAAAAGTCRPDSLLAALKLAETLANNRAASSD
jgi:4-hydroxythreonine-4-phosphate dehydrogenase